MFFPFQITSCHILSCHAMSDHVTSHHPMSWHVTPWHLTSHHATPHHAMPHHVMQCHAMTCYIMFYHICHAMSCHVYNVISCCYVMSYVMSHTLQPYCLSVIRPSEVVVTLQAYVFFVISELTLNLININLWQWMNTLPCWFANQIAINNYPNKCKMKATILSKWLVKFQDDAFCVSRWNPL